MLGSNFALLVKSPGDDGQQLLTTGSSYVYRCIDATIFPDSTWVLSDIKSSAESRKCLILSNYKFYRKKRRF